MYNMALYKFLFKEDKMSQINFNYVKSIIRTGIEEKITFAQLREKLPGLRKRQLQSLIFDVMAEMNLRHVPFPGLLKRPRLSRAPIPVDEDGNLCIRSLLEEKGFIGRSCAAFAHIGDNKITLTIKPANIPEHRDPEIYG